MNKQVEMKVTVTFGQKAANTVTEVSVASGTKIPDRTFFNETSDMIAAAILAANNAEPKCH